MQISTAVSKNPCLHPEDEDIGFEFGGFSYQYCILLAIKYGIPQITEELIRKRAEHNECIIGTLEELSLHQEDIEKIEHLQNWCKELQILYLQANLISKIENLHKLKKLQYLNLAVNNIEVIENLEKCESLEKLDLTLNFIGNIESVSSLKNNIHLKYLYLTGNPCCDYEGYRQYVIVQLPQLENLDVTEITKSERIKAQQNFDKINKNIMKAQSAYRLSREAQRERLKKGKSHLSDDEFWKSSSENAPETRIEIAQRTRKARGEDKKEEPVEKSVSLFAKDGRPLNINQAKLDFTFSDENPEEYVLDLAVYKYLDTNLIEIDLQPIYVRILIKSKIFQIVFPEEIKIDKSAAQRSQTTGHLVLRMPRLNYVPRKKIFQNEELNEFKNDKARYEYLEVEPNKNIDICNIMEQNQKQKFEDNPEVPPLEFG